MNTWKDDLMLGHNVLLWGLGSKREQIKEFVAQYWKHGVVVEIDGFRPGCKLRDAIVIATDRLAHHHKFQHRR